MIAVTVEKRYGTATVRVRVRAASLEQALRWVGEDARVVFPKDVEHFIVPEDAPEGVEEFLPVRNEQVVAA